MAKNRRSAAACTTGSAIMRYNGSSTTFGPARDSRYLQTGDQRARAEGREQLTLFGYTNYLSSKESSFIYFHDSLYHSLTLYLSITYKSTKGE